MLALMGLIYHHRPDVVAVFGADHIYCMDINQMVQFYLDHEADMTVAALPVSLNQGHNFGIINPDSSFRIIDFQEKPAQPKPIPGDPQHCLSSMGNYQFKTEVLIDALQEAYARGEKDFGHDVLPRLIRTHKVCTYDLTSNRIPGVKAYEEPSYWRDAGNLEDYHAAHMDLLGLEPRFDTFNPDVDIEDCIIKVYSVIGRGSRLRRAIIGRYNLIEPATMVGYLPTSDRQRYHISPSGIVVVPKGGRGQIRVY